VFKLIYYRIPSNCIRRLGRIKWTYDKKNLHYAIYTSLNA